MRFLLFLLALYASRALASWVNPVYTFSIEFVTGSFTNVSSRMERGLWDQNLTDLFSQPSPKTALFELANDDGLFTPRQNTNLKPGKAVKLSATHGGSTYPLFFGRITEVSLSPRLGARTTLIQAIDDWDRVSRLTYTTSLYQNIKTQSLFCQLMSMSSVQSFSADASIADQVDFMWYRDRPAAEALNELVRSGNYALVLDGNGTYYLRDRYWALFASTVNTYSALDDVQFSLSQESVVNQMKMNAQPRQLTSVIATLAFIPQAISIPASTGINFWLAFQDPLEPSADVPVSSLVTPVSSTDYYSAANSDGTGTNLTSALQVSFTPFAASAVSSIFNGGGTDMYLTRFQVRGYPVKRLAPLGARYDVASSQSAFGLRNITVENALLQNYSFMDNLTKTLVVERKDGRDAMKLTLTNEFPDNLSILPGNLVSVVDTFAGYSTLWRVRGASHEITQAQGLRHSTSYNAEAYDTLPYLVLDHATMGKLDAGRMLSL